MVEFPVVLITASKNLRIHRDLTLLVEYGLELRSGLHVIMPAKPLSFYIEHGASFDKDIGEYILW